MPDNRTTTTAWSIYSRLHDALSNIATSLDLTIKACDLITEKRREGVEVDYFDGNEPGKRISVRSTETVPAYDHVEHKIKTAIECMEADWIPVVWDNLRPAQEMLDQIPAALQADLDVAASGRWVIQTRRLLNTLANSPSPYRGFLTTPPQEAGFPRNVSEALYVCRHAPSRKAWSHHLEQVRQRLEDLRACRPPSFRAELRQNTNEGSGDQQPAAARALEALMGSEDAAILQIARSDASTDDRMRAIYRIDNRVVAWNSQRWADLLNVSDGAVRKTRWWKADRPSAIAAADN